MHSRYRIDSIIDQGGMGTVFRAYDRLTETWVALKQLTLELEAQAEGTDDWAETATLGSPWRLALAAEFRLLATLRHPNIVSVLDYGFAQNIAFFTMEFLVGGTSLVQATRGQPLATQLALLGQFFQALEYIRRHQVVHRDIKPANVLVQQGQVKVLDFGIAALEGVGSPTAGSLLYMAPETLNDQPFTHVTDLFAAGVMAYEVLAGRHPFEGTDKNQLIQQILHVEPDYTRLNGPPALRAVVARLLAKNPAARFPTAAEALAALAEASGEALPLETQATRASLIQAAQFVGREAELAQLLGALAQTQAGHGSVWLLGGESGVGKSRLLDELRIQALVRQAWVWQGQAVSEGGQPAQLWRDIFLWLLLVAEPNDAEVAVLQPFVPQGEALLDRNIPPAPPLAASAAQERLCVVVVTLLQRVATRQPIVLLLEDLHWAGSLSLAILTKVMQEIGSMAVLVVGNYRNDEQPTLPQQLPSATLLPLNRLTDAQVTTLTSAILGLPTERIGALVKFLQQQTEGNAFFVVEVLRSLAEEAGLLSEVQTLALPEHLLVGGMQHVVWRRLQRMAEEDYPWLELAAVAGRELELPLLQHLASEVDWQAWLSRCADAVVLEPQGEGWRFAHDQLRQGVLTALAPARAKTLHQTVAQGVEQLHAANLAVHYSRLAYHYQCAEQWEKTLAYHGLAGDAANGLYAHSEARAHYTQALEALQHLPETPEYCRRWAETLIKRVAVAWAVEEHELNFKRLHEAEAWLQKIAPPEQVDRLLHGRVIYWLGRLHYARNEIRDAMGHYQQAMAIGREFNDAELLAIPSAFLGQAMLAIGQINQARPLLAQAVPLLAQAGSWAEWGRAIGAYSVVLAEQGHYTEAWQESDRSLSQAQESRNPARLALAHLYRSGICQVGRDMPRLLVESEQAIRHAEQAGERMLAHIAYTNQAWAKTRLGQLAAAQQDRAHSIAISKTLGGRILGESLHTVLDAEIALNLNQLPQALRLVEKAAQMAQASGDNYVLGLAHCAWGQVCAALTPPDWAAAQTHFAESVRALESVGHVLYAAHTQVAWGKMCAAQNDAGAAREHFTQALKQYQTSAIPHLIAETQASLQALPS